jgi:hypothetical protein
VAYHFSGKKFPDPRHITPRESISVGFHGLEKVKDNLTAHLLLRAAGATPMNSKIVFATLALAVIPAFAQNHFNPRTPPNKPRMYSSTGLGDGVLPQIADGGGWQTMITIVNLRSTATTAYVDCVGDKGTPQPFDWEGMGSYPSLQGPISGYGTIELFTTGTSVSLTQGYCLVSTTDAPGNEVAAFAIYSYAPTGQQVSVPASPVALTNSHNSLMLAFDNTYGYAYGVALVDTNTSVTGNTGDTVNWTVQDTDGNVTARGSFTIAPMGHTAFVLSDAIPATVNARGTVTFTIVDTVPNSMTPGTLVGLGLRACPSGALTSVDMFEPMTY